LPSFGGFSGGPDASFNPNDRLLADGTGMMERVVMRTRRQEQVPTGATTARAIVRSPYFAAGVDDVRRGLPPRFDLPEADRDWAYERGRAWAILAPRDLDPHSNLAVRLLEAAVARKWIV